MLLGALFDGLMEFFSLEAIGAFEEGLVLFEGLDMAALEEIGGMSEFYLAEELGLMLDETALADLTGLEEATAAAEDVLAGFEEGFGVLEGEEFSDGIMALMDALQLVENVIQTTKKANADARGAANTILGVIMETGG